MTNITSTRLYMLKAMYLLVALGNAITIWPEILFPPTVIADSHSVVRAFLGALSLLALLGLRYPVTMIPLLLFEFCWKLLWVLAFASRMWVSVGLDAYAMGVFTACMLGILLTPIVIPWRYLFTTFFKRQHS